MTRFWERTSVLATALVWAAVILICLAPQAQSETGDFSSKGRPPDSLEEKWRKTETELLRESRNQESPERRVDYDPEGNPYVAGELIVTYESEASTQDIRDAVEEFGATVEEDFPEIDAKVLEFLEIEHERSQEAREQTLERKRRSLELNPDVEVAEYNYLRKPAALPNDEFFNLQWGLSRINAPAAWNKAKGQDTIINVLDSGIDQGHPDIGGVVGQFDFVNGDSRAEDNTGHGTHVAGTAAALTDNSEGIAGASPLGLLLIGKVCEKGLGCPSQDMIDALYEGADFGVDVINMSIWGDEYVQAEQNAVNYARSKGVVVVVAAGNEAQRGNPIGYPAGFQNVIAVGSTNIDNGKSDFSSFGNYVDVVAPGGQGSGSNCTNSDDVLSTYARNVVGGGYAFECGTSMSAPHVAGLASLLASQGLSTTNIYKRIVYSARDLGPYGKDSYYGWGIIDAQAAVTNSIRPTITDLRPAPGSKTRDRTPTISAHVRDKQTNLGKRNAKLYIDGKRKAKFSYSAATDRLTYRSGRLSYGRHVVKVVAQDAHGLATTKTARFQVIKG